MTDNNTKDELLDTAQTLIQKVGVNAMSYQHLSDEVGIRKASIHYHFPKKDDLIEAILSRCSDNYTLHYRSIAQSDKTVLEKLRMVAIVFEGTLREGKLCTVGMLSVEMQTLSEQLQSSLKKTINRCVKVIAEIFAEGVSTGVFPDSEDTMQMAHAYHDFLLGAQIIARCQKSNQHFKSSVEVYLSMLG